MRKLFLSASLALAFVAPSFAKTKVMLESVGVQVINFMPSAGLGFGVKAHQSLSEKIRLSGEALYAPNNGFVIIDLSVNAHYLLYKKDKISLYPLAGIGYQSISQLGGQFIIKAGIGGNYKLSDKLTAGVEYKYQMNQTGSQVGLNLMYNTLSLVRSIYVSP